jgi:CheY-like chemotaxis protein
MTGSALTAKTVVIADDTAFVRDRFRSAVENAGHKAITVKSAAELLARVRADLAQIDLIVLDLRLPHAPGVELVRSVRKLDDGRLPILIFSGTIASADEVRDLAALGVAGYVNEYSAVQHILPSLAPHLFPDNFNRRSSPRVVLGIPIQEHDRGRAHAQPQPRRDCHPDDQPAREQREDQSAVPDAGIEARHRRGGTRRLERPARGHGHPVRESGSGEPDGHRPIRRRALLQQQESLDI